MNKAMLPTRMGLPWVPVLLSVGIVSLIGFVGAASLLLGPLRRHGFLLVLVAMAAGTLLGDAFFHLLPEAAQLWGEFTPTLAAFVLVGFLIFYLLESLLRMGHAHAEAQTGPHPGEASVEPFGWLNLIGDAVHNFLDGLLVGATYLADFSLGVATTIAVAVHEIPQEFGDFGILLKAGFRPAKALLVNFASALFAIAGAVLILLLPFPTEVLERYALPLVAGGFLYIAAADLVPELHHHAGPRHVPRMMAALVVGMALMATLLLLE